MLSFRNVIQHSQSMPTRENQRRITQLIIKFDKEEYTENGKKDQRNSDTDVHNDEKVLYMTQRILCQLTVHGIPIANSHLEKN